MTGATQEEIKEMDAILGKIGQTHSGDGGSSYVPASWVIENQGGNHSVVHRNTGDAIADDILSYTAACKIAEMLNRGVKVNSEQFNRLIETNLEYEKEQVRYARTRLDESKQRATELLAQIAEM